MASSTSVPVPPPTRGEFATSTTPPPTILVPRPHALRLLELCESAEVGDVGGGGSSTDFLGFIDGDGDKGEKKVEASGSGDAGDPRKILTAQLALLIYLGEYGHARHLWRRHRDGAAPANDGDLAQLEMLWGAARHVCAWSDGGLRSFGSGSSSPTPAGGGGGEGMMQVEIGSSAGSATGSAGGEDDDLPRSTLALRALRRCAESNVEPVATYARELGHVVRSRTCRRLRDSFDRLRREEFCLRMDLDSSSPSSEGWGWRTEGEYAVPDDDAVSYDDGVVDEGEEDLAVVGVEGHRIGKLTEYVMFLEGKVNA